MENMQVREREDTKFLLEKVYECVCFDDENQFEEAEARPKNAAVLLNGDWFLLLEHLASRVFDPFSSLSCAQSMLVHIFYNRPALNREEPIISLEDLSKKIFDQEMIDDLRKNPMKILLNVSARAITQSVIELLREKDNPS